jgi:hypothetical protein
MGGRRTWRRFGRWGAALMATSCAACISAIAATDGSVGGVSPGALTLVGANVQSDLYAVAACGQRVSYSLSSRPEDDGRSQRLFLVARLPLNSATSSFVPSE